MNLTIGDNLDLFILIIANLLLTIILFGMNLSNKNKIKKLKAKYYRFMTGISASDANLDEVLEHCIDRLDDLDSKCRELELMINKLERDLFHCIQKVGVVRYNAFDNVGSDLSFSIALLDNNDDGLVMSSLFSRDSSSIYAKPIHKGKSKYALSAEELKAIDIAKRTSVTSKYIEQETD